MSQTLSKLPTGKQANVKKREPLFTLNVTGPRLAAGLIAGLIAIGWIFLLGMVAGQMYPGMLSRESADSAPHAGTREPAQASAPREQRNGVIQPEDLEYKQRAGTTTASGATGGTRSGGAAQTGGATAPAGGAATGSLGSANAPTVAAGQIGGASPAGQTSASANTAANRQTGQTGQANAQAGGAGAAASGQATGQVAGQAAGQAANQGAAQMTAQSANPDQRFNYTYQIASFKAREQAQTLVDKLTKDGLTSQINQVEANAATWYRVMVNFTGTEAETRNLKNTLGKYGISQVIMYAKTPATGR